MDMAGPATILASDPGAAYRARRAEIDEAVRRVLQSGWYILGREVESFEGEFAAYLGAAHAVGVASGTDGLHLALRACGVGPGDAVVTVSHTAVATVAAVELAGAVPVLADIDRDSYTMDPQSLDDALRSCAGDPRLGGRVKAVVPVHLYGRPADMVAIRDIARRHDLRGIEDCSQSHGAAVGGKKVGTLGDVGVFSLYPTKNLGALGDAGIVSTNDARLAERLRLLREYGWRQRNHSELPGLNSRLDELQAAVLRVRLRHLDKGNAARRALAALYDDALTGSPLVPPARDPETPSVYHQYVIRCARRDELRARLGESGVQTLIHYPEAVHQQPAYRDRLPRVVPLERTQAAVAQILSLPMYPELPPGAVRRVARLARDLAREASR
jgi:dTDP-4-amino-4,6-dideoxygalactose transaminase